MADVTKTRNDLINRAYGILASTQTPPDADDTETIDDHIDPLVAQLSADDIITIDPAEIPVEYFMPLVRLLVNNCGPAYGSPMNDAAKQADEATLRRLVSRRPTREVLSVDYF